MTKKIALTVIVCVLIIRLEADPNDNKTIQWLTMEQVQEMVKKESKPIFIDVYTDWCGWCKKMDKATFNNENVAEYVNEHYYAVKMNAESSEKFNFKGYEVTPRELTRAFKVSGFPTIVLMDGKLENVHPVSGYKEAKEFQKLLEMYKNEVN